MYITDTTRRASVIIYIMNIKLNNGELDPNLYDRYRVCINQQAIICKLIINDVTMINGAG